LSDEENMERFNEIAVPMNAANCILIGTLLFFQCRKVLE